MTTPLSVPPVRLSGPPHAVWAHLAARWAAYLWAPVDGASLAVFRMMFGGLLFWEVLRYFQNGWIATHYITPTFHFTYPLFDFVRPWPGWGMYVHFALMGLLALLIAVGLCYRLATALFFLAFSYVFLLDQAFYLNHFYLIVLLSFLLCLVPAHAVASLDRWLFLRQRPPVVPRWAVGLLRAQLFIVYFYAGLAKLSPDWLQGQPMRLWLAERTDFPGLGPYFTAEWVVFFFAYGGLLFDLSIGFLLLGRRTRPWALGMAAVFHGLNSQLFQIGIFPALALGATLIFADPAWPRQVGQYLRQWGHRTGRPQPPVALDPAAPHPLFSARLWLIVLHGYLLVQLLIPLRHWVYPGDVNWTEEGHRFAWHMKLRTKVGILHLYLTRPDTGQTWEINPGLQLSQQQLAAMSTQPDMVVQYAHYLANTLSRNGWPRLEVRADLQVSLNGRPYQPLIDPTVNLAEVPRNSWLPAYWILPLTVPLASPVAPHSLHFFLRNDFLLPQ